MSGVNISHNIVNCNQVCSNWCWATSATMAASAFGGGSDCASEEAEVAGHAFGTTCDSSCSSTCNHGGTMTETCEGIELLCGHKYNFVPNALQPEDLDSALQIGPVVLGEQWSLGGGHAITVSGVSDGKYIGHDPEGYPISTDYLGLLRYSPPYCQYPCFGTWMATSSPSDVGPAPSPRPAPTPPSPAPTPPMPLPTPTPTPTPAPMPTPLPTPGACHAISAVATDTWCVQNCAAGYCPSDLCDCGDSVLV